MTDFALVASPFGRLLLTIACLGAATISAGMFRLHSAEYRSEASVAVRFVGFGAIVTAAALIAAVVVA